MILVERASARWYPLKAHPIREALWNSPKRFVCARAGRRSGKTELMKRKCGNELLRLDWAVPDPLLGLFGPTELQAKRIFWDDMKRLIPSPFVAKVNEVELTIRMVTGARLMVVGLDRPQRIEGLSFDWAGVDEFAALKPNAWPSTLRPMLSDVNRPGRAWICFKPRGKNHAFRFWQRHAPLEDWGLFHWPSWEVLAEEEIEAAKQELDEHTFREEYGGEFVDVAGRAYYAFEAGLHCKHLREKYDADAPLYLAFDFNVSPGIAAVAQDIGDYAPAWIGEVWIPNNSTTPKVCRKLIEDWGKHRGPVYLDGDASGGSRGSAKVEGSDWDLIRDTLRPVFGDRLRFRAPSSNPDVRARVNAVNSRLRNAAGHVRMAVDPRYCPHLVEDLEGTMLVEGGEWELDKSDEQRTHLTDAIGYHVNRRFPLQGNTWTESSTL